MELVGPKRWAPFSRAAAGLAAGLLVLVGCASGGNSDDPTSGVTLTSGSTAPTGTPSVTATSPTPRMSFITATPTPSGGTGFDQCSPAEVEMPAWVPEDLPLPEGTFATQLLEDLGGYHRILLTLPNTSTRSLARLVLNQWPKAGWQLGRGDAEPGEIEDNFSRPPAVGAFKAVDMICDPPFVTMLLIYAPDRSKIEIPTIAPSATRGSPLQPSPTTT